jgi:hypothetical protein
VSVQATLVRKQPLEQARLPSSTFERRFESLRTWEAAYQGEIDEGAAVLRRGAIGPRHSGGFLENSTAAVSWCSFPECLTFSARRPPSAAR